MRVSTDAIASKEKDIAFGRRSSLPDVANLGATYCSGAANERRAAVKHKPNPLPQVHAWLPCLRPPRAPAAPP